MRPDRFHFDIGGDGAGEGDGSGTPLLMEDLSLGWDPAVGPGDYSPNAENSTSRYAGMPATLDAETTAETIAR